MINKYTVCVIIICHTMRQVYYIFPMWSLVWITPHIIYQRVNLITYFVCNCTLSNTRVDHQYNIIVYINVYIMLLL